MAQKMDLVVCNGDTGEVVMIAGLRTIVRVLDLHRLAMDRITSEVYAQGGDYCVLHANERRGVWPLTQTSTVLVRRRRQED